MTLWQKKVEDLFQNGERNKKERGRRAIKGIFFKRKKS